MKRLASLRIAISIAFPTRSSRSSSCSEANPDLSQEPHLAKMWAGLTRDIKALEEQQENLWNLRVAPLVYLSPSYDGYDAFLLSKMNCTMDVWQEWVGRSASDDNTGR